MHILKLKLQKRHFVVNLFRHSLTFNSATLGNNCSFEKY